MNQPKYKLIDQTELFEFHDSCFVLDHISEQEMSVYVTGLNISKNAEQNPKEYDLEIEKAHIVFRGVSDLSYDPGRIWTRNENGESMPVGPEIIYRGQEALDRAAELFQEGAEIFSHSILNGDYVELEGLGNEPYFFIRFKAEHVVIEWDAYSRPAWYVSMTQFYREIKLNTPDGEKYEKLHFILTYDPDELFSHDSVHDSDPKEISVGLKYCGHQYWGKGTECTGSEALAGLQKKLPAGVELKCCLSCRHGNMDPFGNYMDNLYCTKGVIIREKNDMGGFMAKVLKDAEAEKKVRHLYTDFCGDWTAQNDECFVYSDYPYQLKDK